MGTEVSPGLKMEIWNSSEFISVQAAAKAKAQEGTLPRRPRIKKRGYLGNKANIYPALTMARLIPTTTYAVHRYYYPIL